MSFGRHCIALQQPRIIVIIIIIIESYEISIDRSMDRKRVGGHFIHHHSLPFCRGFPRD